MGAAKARIRVVAGLFVRGTRVLVQQRAAHKARGSLWEFPGGKVEPGESDAQALERECREELGVDVRAGRELWRTVHEYADLVVELIFIGGTMARAATPAALDAARLSWVEAQALARLPFCAADEPFVRALAAGTIQLSGAGRDLE